MPHLARLRTADPVAADRGARPKHKEGAATHGTPQAAFIYRKACFSREDYLTSPVRFPRGIQSFAGLLMMETLQRIDQRKRARSLLSAVLGRPHAALQRRSANPGLTQSAHAPCLRAILRRCVTRTLTHRSLVPLRDAPSCADA
ncbi:hypothetical protein NDU88_006769 [Pleurodeles waltl]|uniref:Uncharacterized protein n=1 Tax=Pleurodeles waltl TaxID=8319 RepID=A0AAV7LQK7_PLEWA|nr:hypothetical protein NDU88_006769 [Pleurodeles waltl]